MMIRRAVGTLAISIFGATLAALAPVTTAAQAPSCRVEITTPKAGDQVGHQGRVRGAATIPPGTHLWVMAHMKDLALEWWPQAGREAVIEPDGSWVIIAGYGVADDVGEAFEVAAVVVDENTHRRLQEWAATSKKTKEYPPIDFPTPVDECVPVKVEVAKVSH